VSRADLFVGNSAEVLKSFKSESVDLAISSFPYDGLKAYNGFSWDWDTFMETQRQLFRVTKTGGVCVLVLNDQILKGNRSCSSLKYVLAMQSEGWLVHDLMAWVKRSTPYQSPVRYAQAWEIMPIMSKLTKPKSIHLQTKPNVKAGRVQKGKDGREYRIKAEGVMPNVVELDVGANKTLTKEERQKYPHDAPFPVGLAEFHVNSWSSAGDMILDVTCGISSVGVAVGRAGKGRCYKGIDISGQYIKWSHDRLKDQGAFDKIQVHKGC
jgi:DNA modification methylase